MLIYHNGHIFQVCSWSACSNSHPPYRQLPSYLLVPLSVARFRKTEFINICSRESGNTPGAIRYKPSSSKLPVVNMFCLGFLGAKRSIVRHIPATLSSADIARDRSCVQEKGNGRVFHAVTRRGPLRVGSSRVMVEDGTLARGGPIWVAPPAHAG